MAKVIDILVGIDAEAIVHDYGKLGQGITDYTYIPQPPEGGFSKYILMWTEKENSLLNQGNYNSNLTVKADLDDAIRFREVTMSKNTEYSAVVVQFMPLTPKKEINIYLSDPIVKPVHSYVPNLKSVNPLDITVVPVDGYYWESTVINMPPPGIYAKLNYSFYFKIYHNGKSLGYVLYDPAIMLDNR